MCVGVGGCVCACMHLRGCAQAHVCVCTYTVIVKYFGFCILVCVF